MKSLRLCVVTVCLCYFYTGLAEEPLTRFDLQSYFNKFNCSYESIVFNLMDVSLMRCVALCAEHSWCYGVFYNYREQNCTACMTLFPYYKSMPHEFIFDTNGTGTWYLHVNWVSFEGSSYLLGTEPMSYVSAEKYCRGINAHLVEIETEAENTFLKDFIQRASPTHGYWIALIEEDGQWRWTTSRKIATFTYWINEKRLTIPGIVFCVGFHETENFKWKEWNCIVSDYYRPLCEKESSDLN